MTSPTTQNERRGVTQAFEDEVEEVAIAARDEWVQTTRRDIKENGGYVDEVKKEDRTDTDCDPPIHYASAIIYYYPKRGKKADGTEPPTNRISGPSKDSDGKGLNNGGNTPGRG